MRKLGYRITHPTKCKQCGRAVFFHTNGDGDAVFFDDLGWPWPVHPCYQAFIGGRLREDPAAYRARMVAAYGTPRPAKRTSSLNWAPSTLPKRRIDPRAGVPQAPLPDNIVKCAPEHCRKPIFQVDGFVNALHTAKTLRKFSGDRYLAYEEYFKVIGSALYTQITVVDRDLLSYTAIIPIPAVAIDVGVLVSVRLRRIEVLGTAHFLCESVGLVAFGGA